MTRPRDDLGRDAPEREDLQKAMGRWRTLPVPVAPGEVLEARRARGMVTLRAAIGSAKREGRARRMRTMLGAAAAIALAIWGGLRATSGPEHAARTQEASEGAPNARATSLSGSPSASLSNRELGQPGVPEATVGALSFVDGSSFVDGRWEIARDTGEWEAGRPDRALQSGDRVRALDRPIELSLRQITAAHVARRSVLSITALEERRQELRLLSGSAEFEVDPKRAAEVIVHAANARIRVTGTAFSVAVGGTKTASWSEVVVKLGHVEIVERGEFFVVEAGQSWASREFPAEGRRADSSSAPFSSKTLARVRKSATQDTGGIVTADDGSTDEASTTLSEENRLFRAALSARNGGAPARCVSLLSDLLTKFPSSPLRQEAMVAQFRCLRSGGQTATAHRTALRYLSEYPNGFARDEARGLVVDVTP